MKDSFIFSKLSGKYHEWHYYSTFPWAGYKGHYVTLLAWDLNGKNCISTSPNPHRMNQLFLQYALNAITKINMKHSFSLKQGKKSICHNNECLLSGPLWLNSYKASKSKKPCLTLCITLDPALKKRYSIVNEVSCCCQRWPEVMALQMNLSDKSPMVSRQGDWALREQDTHREEGLLWTAQWLEDAHSVLPQLS